MCYPVSPLQVCCDGCGIAPLEIGVQPMQASPCVQGLRHFTLHTFAFSRFADMLFSPLPFGIRSVSCPRRLFALNLLLLWSYLTSAEAAHSHIPTHAEAICCMLHEQALGADIFKEHHQLQFEEDHRINRGSTTTCVGSRTSSCTNERSNSLQMPVKVILGNQVLQRDRDQWGKRPLF